MTPVVPSIPRPLGLRRGVLWLGVAGATTVVGSGLAAQAPAAQARVPRSQALVVLTGDHVARSRPSAHGHRIRRVRAVRPLTHQRTVLPVLGRAMTRGRPWVRVRLPGRPNGRAGWIAASQTRNRATAWRLSISLSARQVTAYSDGRVQRRFRAVVGSPSTPTPRGHFFVEEAVALGGEDEGGPYALATSARSDVLQEFHGGPGQIALHGTNHLPDPLGTAASHGCVRLSPRAITWLARRIGRGVPVTISA